MIEKKTKILFFTKGDSNDIALWSNVPFLFAYNLEKQKINLCRINIAPSRKIEKIFNLLIYRILNISNYTFSMTKFYETLCYNKIKNAIKKNPDADLCIFMTFNFYNKYSNIPSIVFSDWTYEMKLKYFNHDTKPNSHYLYQESRVLKNAEIIIPFFRETYDYITNKLTFKNIFHPLFTPVNILNLNNMPRISLNLHEKFKSNEIIFIGGRHYKDGLILLINAVKDLKYKINVIGMTHKDIDEDLRSGNINFFGYLNKKNPYQNKIYYDLLKKSKIIVNPSQEWNGYSSILEAMYLYTPIIITPNNEFKREFGESISFGFYIDYPDNLTKLITSVMNLSEREYIKMCKDAHNNVKNNTWEKYVKTILCKFDNYSRTGRFE